MLKEKFSPVFLKKNLIPAAKWHPWPTASERQRWNSLSENIRKILVTNGIGALKKTWPHLPASLFLEFAQNGNRSNFQDQLFIRRQILSDLVYAECIESKGRFLNAIVDAAWSTCEESTWSLPAHINMQKKGVGLPDVTEPIVDLYAGETAAQMAWLVYLLNDQLNKISPLITERIRCEIRQRILIPCFERNDFWWMGFQHKRVNNWNPWINSNWLACILLIEDNEQRRIESIYKALRSIDVFVESYSPDGGCDEGPAYWTRAPASLFDCLELLYWATKGKLNVYDEPLIKEMGRYIYRVHLGNNWFVNFADAPARFAPPAGLIYRYGKRIKDNFMQKLALFFLRNKTIADKNNFSGNPTRTLPNIFLWDKIPDVDVFAPLPSNVWLSNLQVVVKRCKTGSVKGLTLAAKGGHNAENHNHNDVGNFIIFVDGKPLIVDVGVEIYTRKTFSSERYSIWTMQSQYHNLPTINGIMQSAGINFRAKNVNYSCDRNEMCFSMDIAESYPAEAGLRKWVRNFVFRENNIIITDSYEMKSVPKDLFWSFITPCKTKIQNNRIRFISTLLPERVYSGKGYLYFDHKKVKTHIEKIPVIDKRLLSIWGKCLHRLILRPTNLLPTDSFAFRIEEH